MMRKPREIESNGVRIVRVLSVSPIEDDHARLFDIFQRSHWNLYTDRTWALFLGRSLKAAVDILRGGLVQIVISERDLLPGTWREVLEHTLLFPVPPVLMVTSRLADDQLWAEALNLGAFDVLAKPFETDEVIRILSSAWRHWENRQEIKLQGLRDRRAVEQWNAAAG
jgi:DNA-binding response OmpR family regulator